MVKFPTEINNYQTFINVNNRFRGNALIKKLISIVDNTNLKYLAIAMPFHLNFKTRHSGNDAAPIV